MTDIELTESIKRYRSQMLIHSYLYYRRGENIIDDQQFDKRALHLVELQNEAKQRGISTIDWYDDVFADWDGSTGYHLPSDDWIANKAMEVSRLHYSMSSS